MKSRLVILGVFAVFSCKAQQIFPLNTFPEKIPVGSYIKDLNNELNPFVGIWIGHYNGKSVKLEIVKQEHRSFRLPNLLDVYYQDALIVKFEVKDSNNNLLQSNSTTQHEYDKNFIASMYLKNDTVNLYYTGTNCGVGWGTINLKKLSDNQISWSYYPNSTTITTVNCSGNPDMKIYLPDTENLVFTKQ
ncbi:DUF6705 family protein [Chryseobacterium sp. PMSZPI]|uniref:DUF6705 family protein n=1 Tax=Chryseobacterium sp. PMSZPI TaxID=1033900 RepID=UPI000C32ED56|nr:DUF6705 family protein [Chryseobacterium sp. PMSZPI]PKF74681.1 hypothetical protein CW752_07655 [Chryseobacterium sp. PMSZPI]